MKKWKCSVCGYIHTGDEPPETCPVCGADKSKFVLIESEEASSETKKVEETVSTSDEETKPSEEARDNSAKKIIIDKYPQLSQKMTKLHAHPVSVHIPNGVLPLAVLFTFMAAIFDSEAFATAASINMTFVFFSMPFVLFSGYVDWINRFGGNMTKTFRIKMTCGAIIMVLTFILTIWWLAQPGILWKESGSSTLFMFLHLITLIPAIVAGFYGGKLVFLE